MLQHIIFDVVAHIFSMLHYMFFDVALYNFAMLQYLYSDVALHSLHKFVMLHLKFFVILGQGHGGERGAVGEWGAEGNGSRSVVDLILFDFT